MAGKIKMIATVIAFTGLILLRAIADYNEGTKKMIKTEVIKILELIIHEHHLDNHKLFIHNLV